MSATTEEARAERDGSARSPGDRPLKRGEKVDLALLALPTFALALSITIVSTTLGEVTRKYTHQTVVIGTIIGSEGVMALWIPLIAGSWSDVLRSRIGGRLPFVLAGAIPGAVALAFIGFVHSLGLVALVATVFFAFYFVAYEPYRAMYPDLMEEGAAGRAQSTQALARGVGTGCALLGGGLLLSVARPLPFLVAAVILVAAIAAFVVLIVRRGEAGGQRRDEQSRKQKAADGQPGQGKDEDKQPESPLQVARKLPGLIVTHPALRAYFFANALWEAALAGLKAFIILYLTIGLGYPLATSSLIIGGVALVILIGAALAGKAGDRWGQIRVVRIALIAYGAGYLVPIFTTSRPIIGASIPFIALGGGAVMTLAYAILMPLMPKDEHGALTGFYSLSRGVGIVAGPILAGVVIYLTRDTPFKATHGFQAMWIVCSAAAFTSLYFVRRLLAATDDREKLERG